jgi:hypothetical protein
VYHVLGNHDVAGLETGMSSHDVIFGKALFDFGLKMRLLRCKRIFVGRLSIRGDSLPSQKSVGREQSRQRQ